MDRFLLLVCCTALISGSTEARPIRSISNSHSDHGKVILGVRDITNSSATLDWSVPEDRPILEFKISCKGHSNNQALKSDDTIGGEDDSLMHELLEHNVPRDFNHFFINNLKPDYKYSCTLLAAELDGKLPHAWTKLIEPIHFSTLRISTDEPIRTDAPEESSVLDLLTFRQKYGDKSAYIILGAGVPFGITAVAAFIGICILCRKCNAYRKRKTDTYRQVNEDKLNRKLKGVVYNPMAMEYTTKWHQPASYLGPKSRNPQPATSHGGKYKGAQLDSRFDTGFNKPYGKLTIKELVQHLERLRRESPFAEDFKMNDPVSMRTKPTSQSTSRTSSVSSGLSSQSSSIQMKPVIPDMELSTPVFEQPKKAKEERKQDDKTTKTLGGLRASTSRSGYSRPYTKPVLVQPGSVCQSSSGSSDDVILPRLPTHMRM